MTEMNRLYKNKRDAKLAGVCAGVADYFDISVTMLRVMTFIGCFVFPFAIPVGYFIAALILKDKPLSLYEDKDNEAFYRNMRNNPHDTLSAVRHRFNNLDQRMRNMERHVTSKKYQFDEELK